MAEDPTKRDNSHHYPDRLAHGRRGLLLAFRGIQRLIVIMPELEKEIAAFENMQAELEAHHNGKWAVIHGDELIDSFDSFEVAAAAAVERFGRGPFLIRQIGAPAFVMPASVAYRLVPQHA